MNTLPPPIVAKIADMAYQFIGPLPEAAKRVVKSTLNQFQFELTNDSGFTGKTGGVIRASTGLGFVAKGIDSRTGELLIATRGSKTTYDWLTDFHTGVRPGPTGQRVHIGFMRAWESFRSDIDTALSGGSVRHAHCVGHSLGGSLATLNADYCANARNLGVSFYTFGSPRVGLREFSEMLTKRTPESAFRVAHDTDPVTMVPPATWSYTFTHVPYDRPGHVISLNGRISPRDHSMFLYARSVANADWKNLERRMPVCELTEHEGEVLLESIKHNRGGVIQPFMAGAARRLGSLLVWLLKKAVGCAPFAAARSFSLLDYLCLMRDRLEDCKRDTGLAEKFKVFIGGVLRYLGQAVPMVIELSVHTIVWVITLLYSAYMQMARTAMASVG